METWRHGGDWSLSPLSWTVFTKMYTEAKDTPDIYVEFANGHSTYYQTDEAMEQLKQALVARTAQDRDFLDKKLFLLAEKIKGDAEILATLKKDLEKSNADPAGLFKTYWDSFRDVVFGLGVDIFFDDIVCAHLEYFLKEKAPQKFHEYYAALAVPLRLTRTQQEEIDFLEIVLQSGDKTELFMKHLATYAYIPMWFDNVPWTLADMQKRAALYPTEEAIRTRLLQLKNETGRRKVLVKKILEELKPPPEMAKLISQIQEFAYLRQEGELQIGYHNFHGLSLKEKIAHTLGFSLRELHFLTDEEIVANLGQKAPDLKVQIATRMQYCFLISKKGVYTVLTGTEAQRQAAEIKSKIASGEKSVQNHERTGIVGSVGYARGKVRIIRGLGDIDTLLPGEIMVVSGTSVECLSAMQRAAAIVAEIGGITSHAAVVARELGLPCLTRVADATSILKTGDEVEVDARVGILRRL